VGRDCHYQLRPFFMNIEIRKAEAEDVEAIVELMREFAEFENLSMYFEVTHEKLYDAMFGERGFVEGVVAYAGGRTVAYALFFPNFASFRGQVGYYLEDLYILDEFRRLGLGDRILRSIARYAKAQGFQRIDFQVLEWNESAIKFYEKRGAIRDNDERHFRFIDDAFEKLAKPSE